MNIYLASIRALLRDTSSKIRAWRHRSRWVDDGACTCTPDQLRANHTCPDRTPSAAPLSPLLETYEKEMQLP